jgi:hypothetical protein
MRKYALSAASAGAVIAEATALPNGSDAVPPSRWSWRESCFPTVLAGPNFRQGWPSFAGGPNYLPPQGAGFSLLPVHLGYD